MIQGGDSRGTSETLAGTGGPGYQINQEFNDRPHVKGVLSMARSSDPNSAGSQFFIVHDQARHLDGAYTAFGRVTAGLDVVDKIAQTPAGDGGTVAADKRPKIKSIRIVPAPLEMYVGPKTGM
jgi:peptidyl-prolyl cis-trans isomerase B (cyclophilin B)